MSPWRHASNPLELTLILQQLRGSSSAQQTCQRGSLPTASLAVLLFIWRPPHASLQVSYIPMPEAVMAFLIRVPQPHLRIGSGYQQSEQKRSWACFDLQCLGWAVCWHNYTEHLHGAHVRNCLDCNGIAWERTAYVATTLGLCCCLHPVLCL